MTEAVVVETDFVPDILPPNLPDEACETDIATIPLASEPHLPDWQPEIPADLPASSLAMNCASESAPPEPNSAIGC